MAAAMRLQRGSGDRRDRRGVTAGLTYQVGMVNIRHYESIAASLKPGDVGRGRAMRVRGGLRLTHSGTARTRANCRGRVNGKRPVLSGGANTVELTRITCVRGLDVTGGPLAGDNHGTTHDSG